MKLLVALAAYSGVAFVAARSMPGVKLGPGLGPAIGLALVFGILNLLVGWLIGLMLGMFAVVFTVLTLGLGLPLFFFVGTGVNAVVLRLADALLPGFELKGWGPALGLGLVFSMTGWLLRVAGLS